jgi:hypothetical protein
MSSNQRRRRSVSEWSSIVADHRVSGLSARAYCDRSDLALSTFTKWRRRVRVQTESSASGFVAVGCETQVEQTNSPPSWDLELDLGDGMALRLRRCG